MQTVIHISSDDDATFDGALSNTEALLNDETIEVDELALVVNSTGVKRLIPNSRFADRLERCMEHGVTVKACSNSLASIRMDESELMDGIKVVSSAASELSRLQEDGYAYIRP